MKKWLIILIALCSGMSFANIDEALLKKQAHKILNANVTIEDIKESVLPDFYQFTVDGKIVYISTDGRYVFLGDLLDLKDIPRNITEETRKKVRLKLLQNLKPKDPIVLKPTGTPKGKIVIFSDVVCGYCKKLHQEVPKLRALGLEIHYFMLPLQGKDSPSYRQAVAAWCASDQSAALDSAYQGINLKEAMCDHPIDHHYLLGQKMGIMGTPTIIFSDGTLYSGYLPADALFKKSIEHSPS